MIKRIFYTGLCGVVLLGIAPVILALCAGFVASVHGCALDEGSVRPCVIAGADWGEALYTLVMMAWFGLITLPFAAMAGGALVLLVLCDLIRYLSRRFRSGG